MKRNFKDSLRSWLPDAMLNEYTKIKGWFKIVSLTVAEKHRYLRFYGLPGRNDEVQLGAKIMLYTHEVQKGLSHTDFRPGFGRKAIHNLSTALILWNQNNYSQDNMNYKAGLATLCAYKKKHESIGASLPSFYLKEAGSLESLFPKSAGTEIITVEANDKTDNSTKTFVELFENRHSVREYADTPVDTSRLYEAVTIAMKTPSMCNRQPYRLIVITNPEIIKKALSLQGGLRGYALPPVLLAVVSDIRGYLFPSDSDAGYIDGGLFSMSLLLALENESLAACPLSTCLPKKRLKELRSAIHVRDTENLIMLISVGNFTDYTYSPKSERYESNDIVREIS